MTTYQCTKCGKISSNKSQICDSKKEITSFFVCESCNKHSSTAEAICNPTEVAPSYYCTKCGTSGVDEKSFCAPMKL